MGGKGGTGELGSTVSTVGSNLCPSLGGRLTAVSVVAMEV